MPGLTSQGETHSITGLNAAPRITGMAPVPDADTLRTANRPDRGHDMRSFSSQLNLTSVGSAAAGVCLEQHRFLYSRVPV